MVLSLFKEYWREDFLRFMRGLDESSWLIRAVLFNALIVAAICAPLFF